MSWNAVQHDENPFSDTTTINFNNNNNNWARGSVDPPMPQWLQSEQSSTAYVPPQYDNVPLNPSGNAAGFGSSSGQYSAVPNGSENEHKESDPATAIPRMILFTRMINLALSVAMILVSMLSLLTTQSATTGVLACYVVVFACLLCCFETHLKQVSKIIAMNFGFMYSAKSRAAFMIFVGTIMFSMSLFGKLIGTCMLANAAFNIFILFKYPQFEDAQRNHAQKEIKDYLAAHPAFAQQIVNASVSAGVDLFRSNPELARQGTQAVFQAAATSAMNSPQANAGYASV